eukprot:CAMPEP_0198222696 /NCGR_PEP_ID=MMETSP1445-20131203/89246_1 /TAXON_ID=36898 /ORGANISM="Pyramimonas sp., Strain CCMP2087" /LENGTH=40 /DNA_ID= /DNA_START= /DNA_END= /DNA_ORIENTATION=
MAAFFAGAFTMLMFHLYVVSSSERIYIIGGSSHYDRLTSV